MPDRPSTTMISRLCLDAIGASLPPRWNASLDVDGMLVLVASDGKRARFATLTCRSTQPRTLIDLTKGLTTRTEASVENFVVLADFLSPRSRALLRERHINWIDTTENVRLLSSSPGLFIEREGLQRDPWSQTSPLKSLRGAGAERAVRALVSAKPPFGIRELAGRSEISAATLSRVVDLLDREALLERSRTGGVIDVSWRGVLERWAQDAQGVRDAAALFCLEPRGLEVLQRKLMTCSIPYAATGSLAAHHVVPVAPLRTAAIYTTDPVALRRELGLTAIDRGANVLLLEADGFPMSTDVSQQIGIFLAPLAQIAVDLLSGSGREPAEGEAILDWMEEHQDEWRN